MSRYLEYNRRNGSWSTKLEDMNMCKWLVDDVCCNDKCDCLADYPYPRSICELDEDGENSACGCFEKEDGIIEE